IWDTQAGRTALTIPGRPGDWVNGLAFSHDGRRIVAGGKDTKIKGYNTRRGRRVREVTGPSPPGQCVAVSPDDYMIASGSGYWKNKTPGRITLWDASTGAAIRAVDAHAGMVLSAAFSPDGSRLATAGGEHVHDPGDVKVWETTTLQEIRNL